MKARVLRPDFLKYVRRPEQVNYWTGRHSHTIPCRVVGGPSNERPKEGFVWIEYLGPFGTKMRVQVPVEIVIVRHKAMKPWISLPLYSDIQDLIKRNEEYSQVARVKQEAFQESGVIGPSNVPRHKRSRYADEMRYAHQWGVS